LRMGGGLNWLRLPPMAGSGICGVEPSISSFS
jgi:hypothetical protein